MLQGKNPLFIALILGLLAALLAYSGIKKSEKDVKKGWDTVHILVADRDVPQGTELDDTMWAVKEMPEKFVTDSFIVIPEEEGERDKVTLPDHQRVLVPLKRGDPILLTHFETNKDQEFSTMIQKKGRALALELQEKGTVGGWVRPNDHVDVIGTFRDEASHEMRTITLLQNIIVLATGKQTANTAFVPEEEKRYNTVSVLVLPEEAEILTLAQEVGTLTLALRNPEDIEPPDESRTFTDLKTLFTGQKTNALYGKRMSGIQIIKGGQSKGGTETAGPTGGN